MLFRLKIRNMQGEWLACAERVTDGEVQLTEKEALDLLALLSRQVPYIVQAMREDGEGEQDKKVA